MIKDNDETPKNHFSNPNDVTLGQNHDEKSVRMENFDGYETPHLGMKVNPSLENLRRNSKDKDESIELRIERNVIQKKQVPIKVKENKQEEEKLNPLNLIMKINQKSHDYLCKDSLDSSNEELEISKDSEEFLEPEENITEVRFSKKARSSNYIESFQDYKIRTGKLFL